MDSVFYLLLSAVFLSLVPGGIVLVVLGKRFKKKPMVVGGWLTIVALTLFTLIAFSFSIGQGFLFLIFGIPFLMIVGSAVFFVVAIVFLVDGFTRHYKPQIISGFVIIGLIVLLVVVPLVLISIFGLPIALM